MSRTSRDQYGICYMSLKHGLVCITRYLKRDLKGGSYSHFPVQILTKSHRPTAQIPLSQCLPCSNLSPIPIFYCFLVDESQSQCMKSHFPRKKWANPSSHFTPSGPSLKNVKTFEKMFSLLPIQEVTVTTGDYRIVTTNSARKVEMLF